MPWYTWGRSNGHEPLIRQYTQLVTEEIDRLDRVVSEFLYFSKQSPPRFEKTDVNKIILGTQDLLAREASEKGIHFSNRLDTKLPSVMLDPHQMEQVLLNIYFNAMGRHDRGR